MRKMLILCLILLCSATVLSAAGGRRLYRAKCGWIRLYQGDGGYELLVKNLSLGADLRWNLGGSAQEAYAALSEFQSQAERLQPGQFFFTQVDGRQVQCYLRKFFGQYSFVISSKWFEGVVELPLTDVGRICSKLREKEG